MHLNRCHCIAQHSVSFRSLKMYKNGDPLDASGLSGGRAPIDSYSPGDPWLGSGLKEVKEAQLTDMWFRSTGVVLHSVKGLRASMYTVLDASSPKLLVVIRADLGAVQWDNQYCRLVAVHVITFRVFVPSRYVNDPCERCHILLMRVENGSSLKFGVLLETERSFAYASRTTQQLRVGECYVIAKCNPMWDIYRMPRQKVTFISLLSNYTLELYTSLDPK